MGDTLVGKVFSAEELSESARKVMTDEERQAWADAMTERYKVVATDTETGREMIAEEVLQRALNKYPPKIKRQIGGMLLNMTPEQIAQVCSAFDEQGNFKYPDTFSLIEQKK